MSPRSEDNSRYFDRLFTINVVQQALEVCEMLAAPYDPPRANRGHRSPRQLQHREESDGIHDDTDSADDTEVEKRARRPLIQRRGSIVGGLRDDGGSPVGAVVEPGRVVSDEPNRSEKQVDAGGQDKGKSSEMVALLAQLWDLSHSLALLDQGIVEIASLRDQNIDLSPRVDIDAGTIQRDLSAMFQLVKNTTTSIKSLDTWIVHLHYEHKALRRSVKDDEKEELWKKEVAEIKEQVQSVKSHFSKVMGSIRDGAMEEGARIGRTRSWLAKHIRFRQSGITDKEVDALVRAAEFEAGTGVARGDLASYARLWALKNPLTELAVLTQGMRFVSDDANVPRSKLPQSSASSRSQPFKRPSASSRSPRSGIFHGPRLPSDPLRPFRSDYERRFKGANAGDVEDAFMRREIAIRRMKGRKMILIASLFVFVFLSALLSYIFTLNPPPPPPTTYSTFDIEPLYSVAPPFLSIPYIAHTNIPKPLVVDFDDYRSGYRHGDNRPVRTDDILRPTPIGFVDSAAAKATTTQDRIVYVTVTATPFTTPSMVWWTTQTAPWWTKDIASTASLATPSPF